MNTFDERQFSTVVERMDAGFVTYQPHNLGGDHSTSLHFRLFISNVEMLITVVTGLL